MFYVDYDGAYVQVASYKQLPPVIAEDRIFASLVGATTHPDAKAPVTPIKSIKQVAYFDGAEVLANNFKAEGLEPVSIVTEVVLEEVWHYFMNERLHNVVEHPGGIRERRIMAQLNNKEIA